MTDDNAPKGLGESWSHLFVVPDSRTPEERKAAESKEWARRHGRKPKKAKEPKQWEPLYMPPCEND